VTERYGKYNAKPTVIDGHRFPSQREANRYCELRLLARAGELRNLRLQPRYEFRHNGQHICTYVADFAYEELTDTGKWQSCIEDVKGVRTQAYSIKRKLMLAFYHIAIRET
jgi:hypothetical protein